VPCPIDGPYFPADGLNDRPYGGTASLNVSPPRYPPDEPLPELLVLPEVPVSSSAAGSAAGAETNCCCGVTTMRQTRTPRSTVITAFDLFLARPGPQTLAACPAAAWPHGFGFAILPAEVRPFAIASDGKAIIATTSNKTVRKRMDKLARKIEPMPRFT
jgi:hypothetical protein